MTTDNTCETCGAAIPADAPGGGCPRCLLGAGLDAPEGPFDREELARILPQFEIEAFIGQGGMGVVYRARQKSLARTVALKILPREVAKDPAFAERFTRESRALASLNHPNITAVYEAGKAEDLFFLTMEYVDGVNLRQAQEGRGLEPGQALAIVPQICDALQYAHDQGVVHRDIKPENILLDREGRVKIADFGLAKLLRPTEADPTLTGTQQVMGTLHYIAPEQIRTPQNVDHRADIYSLGVVFYEMLTGELPIGRFPVPSERVQVDVRLDEVVLRALERERDQRYQRVSEVKTSVETIATSREPAPAPPTPPAAAPVPPRTRLSSLAVAGILCWPIAILVGLIVVAMGARDEAGIWAGVSVAVTGIILSAIAYHAIKREPDRLHGMRLAKAGFFLPAGLLAVGFVLGALMALLYFGRAEDEREKLDLEAQHQVVRGEAYSYMAKIAAQSGMTPMDEIVAMIDPERRTWFENLPGDESRRRYNVGAMGLGFYPTDDLPARLNEFEVERVVLIEDSAAVVAVHKNTAVEFPMVRRNGKWYLAIGQVHVRPSGR
jgi:predicted Ser/Thr protein kinase